MSLRGIAGILALVAALLLSLSAISKGWYTASRGDRSVSLGPLWGERCDDSDCVSDVLMKSAHGNEMEVFAAAGIAFAGLASITSLLLLIFGILALTRHGGRATGITMIVFVVLTNIAGGAFAGLKPARLSELTSSLGLFLSSIGGMAGLAFGIMMIVAARKQAATAGAPTYAAPPGYPPPGAPQGYPPQPAAQPVPPGTPGPGYPPQGRQG